MTQSQKAERFLALHHGPAPLVLPNAWDAASARIIEDLGFPAIATTSAGIANSLGFPDGQRISRDEMLAAISRIVAAVRVPVSADIEAGYGETPEAVAETIRAVLAAGAIGVNLEDSLVDIHLHEERIRAAREAAHAAGIPLVLNARTDVYLRPGGDEKARFEDAVRRSNAYLLAGADCAYPIGARGVPLISALVAAIQGPVNVLAGPGAPSIPELRSLGVARISFGAFLARAAMGLTRRIARELLHSSAYSSFPEDTISSAEANRLFERTQE